MKTGHIKNDLVPMHYVCSLLSLWFDSGWWLVGDSDCDSGRVCMDCAGDSAETWVTTDGIV